MQSVTPTTTSLFDSLMKVADKPISQLIDFGTALDTQTVDAIQHSVRGQKGIFLNSGEDLAFYFVPDASVGSHLAGTPLSTTYEDLQKRDMLIIFAKTVITTVKGEKGLERLPCSALLAKRNRARGVNIHRAT